jgi:tetratricopeptide (TPR) repeat protein
MSRKRTVPKLVTRVVLIALAVAALGTLGYYIWLRVTIARDPVLRLADEAKRAPLDVELHDRLGLALAAEDRFEQAEAVFLHCMDLDAGYTPAYINLSELYGRTRQYPKALGVLMTIEPRIPDDPQLLNNLGTTYWGMGDTAKAAKYYQKSLAVAPNFPLPRQNLQKLRAGVMP